jgi:hypothetical protein
MCVVDGQRKQARREAECIEARSDGEGKKGMAADFCFITAGEMAACRYLGQIKGLETSRTIGFVGKKGTGNQRKVQTFLFASGGKDKVAAVVPGEFSGSAILPFWVSQISGCENQVSG